MIAYLKGKVIKKNSENLILEVNGVGYKVEISTDGVNIGDTLEVNVYHYIREDAQMLIGFTDDADLQLFEELISISGVGPKLGMAILATYSAADVIRIISKEDVGLFSKVKGLGKKGAERIILELKGKLGDLSVGVDLADGVEVGSKVDAAHPVVAEAKDALTSLGYNKKESEEALQEALLDIDSLDDMDSRDLLKIVLGRLVK